MKLLRIDDDINDRIPPINPELLQEELRGFFGANVVGFTAGPGFIEVLFMDRVEDHVAVIELRRILSAHDHKKRSMQEQDRKMRVDQVRSDLTDVDSRVKALIILLDEKGLLD